MPVNLGSSGGVGVTEEYVAAAVAAAIATHSALTAADPVHGITASNTEPSSPSVNDLWIDTSA